VSEQLSQATREYKLSSGYKTYIFILLFLLYFFDVVDRYIVSSLFPFIQKEWALTDVQSGMLVSTVYWAIVVLTLPISILVDRWSRRKAISIMATLWSFAAMACAFVGNFAQLFTARTFLGVGEAGYASGGTAMIAGMYPEEKRARIMGLWNASIPLATAAGIGLGGVIAVNFGWRAAFGLTAIPGLIVAILFFFVRDYKTVDLVKTVDSASEMSAKIKMKAGDAAREFMRNRTLVLTYLGFAGVQFVQASIITWLATYFHRTGGMPIDQAGLKTGSIMLLAIIGAPVGGYLCDLWVKKKKNARLIFPAIALLVTALLVFLAFSVFTGNLQYVALLLMGLVFTAAAPAAIVVTQEVIHPGLRAISYAVAIIVMNLLGASLGPIVIGAISDASNIQTAMQVLPAFLVVSAVLFFAGSFSFKRDYDRVEKVTLEMES
jgi:MFS family permease